MSRLTHGYLAVISRLTHGYLTVTPIVHLHKRPKRPKRQDKTMEHKYNDNEKQRKTGEDKGRLSSGRPGRTREDWSRPTRERLGKTWERPAGEDWGRQGRTMLSGPMTRGIRQPWKARWSRGPQLQRSWGSWPFSRLAPPRRQAAPRRRWPQRHGSWRGLCRPAHRVQNHPARPTGRRRGRSVLPSTSSKWKV